MGNEREDGRTWEQLGSSREGILEGRQGVRGAEAGARGPRTRVEVRRNNYREETAGGERV